jgi:hypothetical protein
MGCTLGYAALQYAVLCFARVDSAKASQEFRWTTNALVGTFAVGQGEAS